MNDNKLLFTSRLEDHHIFPREYLRKYDKDAEEKNIDCVVNRTLIPKITNIKIGDKKPSVYLNELLLSNSKLEQSLESHLIPSPKDVISGTYDDVYKLFLDDRAKKIFKILETEISFEKELISRLSEK